MITINLIVLALIGAALFIVGQFYGERRIKSKAAYQFKIMQLGFEGYRKALSHVLKERSLVLDELDKEAVAWNMKETLDAITKRVNTEPGAIGISIVDDNNNEAPKDKQGD